MVTTNDDVCGFFFVFNHLLRKLKCLDIYFIIYFLVVKYYFMGIHLMAPYSIILSTNEQYKTLNEEVCLRSFDSLIIMPKTLRA